MPLPDSYQPPDNGNEGIGDGGYRLPPGDAPRGGGSSGGGTSGGSSGGGTSGGSSGGGTSGGSSPGPTQGRPTYNGSNVQATISTNRRGSRVNPLTSYLGATPSRRRKTAIDPRLRIGDLISFLLKG